MLKYSNIFLINMYVKAKTLRQKTIFLKDFIYLFLETGEEREEEGG